MPFQYVLGLIRQILELVLVMVHVLLQILVCARQVTQVRNVTSLFAMEFQQTTVLLVLLTDSAFQPTIVIAISAIVDQTVRYTGVVA